jgi:aspartate-semialdehyde dehydrogenase
MKTYTVGILGATGMVGQRFIALLAAHPWFKVTVLAASPESAGRPYGDVVSTRWALASPLPSDIAAMTVLAVERDAEVIASQCSIVFCALDLPKDHIQEIELRYAALGCFVVSNNSAHRWTSDIPMVLPEINPHHLELIHHQRKSRGWKSGGVVVKPNCSIQSYVPIVTPLLDLKPRTMTVTTAQAISGAGKTFATWPEMVDNVIPFIGGEEEKSEREPLRVWGSVAAGEVALKNDLIISATCLRVPVSDGHMASVSIKFEQEVALPEVYERLKGYHGAPEVRDLPSSPKTFLHVYTDDTFPQTRLHRDTDNGMAISVGRLRLDPLGGVKFVGLSHNTVRGAAGGAVLTAELACKLGYLVNG